MKKFFSISRRKKITPLATTLLLLSAAFPSFAQTADARYAGVFYSKDANGDIDAMYCNWDTSWLNVSQRDQSRHNVSFVTSPAPSGNSNQTDPWVSSALIEYDQP